jgi:hypothetical protein
MLPRQFVQPFRWDNEHQITVTFRGGGWSRSSPADGEHGEYIDVTRYDWSAVYPNEILDLLGPKHEVHDTDEWSKRYTEWLKKWVIAEVCLDPCAYEIINSNWLQHPVLLERGYRHYIFGGEDMYVEVLGKDWNWRSEEEVDWTKR